MKKNILSKTFISIFTIIALLISSMYVTLFSVSAETAAGSFNNLVTNGDFEDGINGWTVPSGITQEIVYDSETDSNVARFTGEVDRYAISQTFGVKANTEYLLTYSYKKLNGRDVVDAYVEVDGENGAIMQHWINFNDKGVWAQKTDTIKTGGNTTLTIRLENRAGEAYIDNISIVRKLNLVENGGFENGTNGWTVPSGVTQEIFYDSETGSNVARFTGEVNRYAISQTFGVKANTEYLLTYSYKKLNGRDVVDAYVEVDGENGAIMQHWINFNDKGVWAQKIDTIKTGSNTKLTIKIENRAGEAYIDNVVVAELAPIEPERILKQGDAGVEVLWVQKKLGLFGYALTENCNFDSETESAVKDFQKKHCVKANGIVDSATVAALKIDPENEPGTGSGDANADGVTDILDLIVLKKYIAAGEASTVSLHFKAVDIANDGILNSEDVAALRHILLGK